METSTSTHGKHSFPATAMQHMPCTGNDVAAVVLDHRQPLADRIDHERLSEDGDPAAARFLHGLAQVGHTKAQAPTTVGWGSYARLRVLSHRCVRVAAVSSSEAPVFDA
jgi:hypothetical protein